jgi:hypothetical protein
MRMLACRRSGSRLVSLVFTFGLARTPKPGALVLVSIHTIGSALRHFPATSRSAIIDGVSAVDQGSALPTPWTVYGRPVGYSAGIAEQQWKEQIRSAVHKSPADHGGNGLFADFYVPRPTKRMPGFDLDNLLDPVLSAVVNTQRWFGGRRPNLGWIAARKHVSDHPRLDLAVLDSPPLLWAEANVKVYLDGPYPQALPCSATIEDFARWVEQHQPNHVPRGPVGVSITFRDGQLNLGDIGAGPIKILIDGLWPLLGGRRGQPNDSRVTALIARKGVVDLGSTVMVKVVGLNG